MRVCIKPSRLAGTANAPPSKSMGHRLLIGAALSDGVSTVHGISDSQDILATLDCLAALGVTYQRNGADVQFGGTATSSDGVLPCRESGSTLRFLLPLALCLNGEARLTGSPRLMERGIGIYEETLTPKGVCFEKASDEIYAVGHLLPGEYVLSGNVSSQFISGLLFALPLLEGDSSLRVLPPVESRGYIDMTITALRTFGICITEPESNTFYIKGSQRYCPTDVSVEGDWSNAAFLYALQTLGHDVTVTDLDPNSLQGDKVCVSHLAALKDGYPTIDLSNCPDLGPILFAVAAACHGATFTGTRRLRIKESDRARAMADELAAMGIRVDVDEDSVTVHGGTLSSPARPLCGHNDHRIVMALTVLLSLVGGEIHGAEAVSKSYPDFFAVMERLGLEVAYDME